MREPESTDCFLEGTASHRGDGSDHPELLSVVGLAGAVGALHADLSSQQGEGTYVLEQLVPFPLDLLRRSQYPDGVHLRFDTVDQKGQAELFFIDGAEVVGDVAALGCDDGRPNAEGVETVLFWLLLVRTRHVVLQRF